MVKDLDVASKLQMSGVWYYTKIYNLIKTIIILDL